MWCGDHTDMDVCTFPAHVKAVSVLCAVCVLHEHTHPYAVHTMCTCVLTDVNTS